MPPIQETTSRSSNSVQSVARLTIIALGTIAILSFLVVYGYLGTMQEPQIPAQVAAVATADPFESISLVGQAAIVVDLVTGEVLYEKNPDAQLPLASITKVPLAIVVAEAMDRDQKIVIPYDTAPLGAPHRLAQGETWRIQDVIDLTLIASSNSGADILSGVAEQAVHQKYPQAPMGGATLWRMNNLASELELNNTYFLNVSGLDESTTQSGAYGSARDVARIFGYAAALYPDVFAGTTKDGLLLTAEGHSTSVRNTNEALGEIPGLMLGKTGFTDLAGGNLAVVFDAGLAHPIAAVVLGSTRDARFTDMKTLVHTAREAINQ